MLSSSSATAPGKVILFGEHAVVYGVPAIAIPVPGVSATAVVSSAPHGSGLWFENLSNNLRQPVSLIGDLSGEPTTRIVQQVCRMAGVSSLDAVLTLQSSIPIASGLGSGAAVAAAVGRALAKYLQVEMTNEGLNLLVYDIEKLHHGTPSGIDNTVIVYEMPVFFRPGAAIDTLSVGAALSFLVADTGVSSSTGLVVNEVRAFRQSTHRFVDSLFGEIAALVWQARSALAVGDVSLLGALMVANHRALQSLTVSSPGLDRLVNSALDAGAFGAKLSGGGRGGNMIVLVPPPLIEKISEVLRAAGAAHVMEAHLPCRIDGQKE